MNNISLFKLFKTFFFFWKLETPNPNFSFPEFFLIYFVLHWKFHISITVDDTTSIIVILFTKTLPLKRKKNWRVLAFISFYIKNHKEFQNCYSLKYKKNYFTHFESQLDFLQWIAIRHKFMYSSLFLFLLIKNFAWCYLTEYA